MAAKTLPVRVDRLQLLLDSRGWSAYRLAQEIAAKHGGSMETAKAKVNSYLRGQVTRAGRLTLVKIAEVFGPEITPEWLAGLTDELAMRPTFGHRSRRRVDSRAGYDSFRVTDAASFAQYQLQVMILKAWDTAGHEEGPPPDAYEAHASSRYGITFSVTRLTDADFWQQRLLRFAGGRSRPEAPELTALEQATEHLAVAFQLILAPWLAGGQKVTMDLLALEQMLLIPTEADREKEIGRRIRARDRLEKRVGKATESNEPELTDAEFGALFKRGAKAGNPARTVTVKREQRKAKGVTTTRGTVK